MMFLAVAACSILALAAGLLIVGLRGRRVDDHPLCRRCGFDLTGRPEESTRCAECGADLTRRRAVRVGRRVRRGGALGFGTLLLVVAIVPLATLGWGRARGVDWNRHKPGWWLVAEAKGADIAARDAALAELVARIAAGTLAEADRAALAERGLEEQADAAKPWAPAWGRVVELARDAGKLDDEAWQRYQRQLLRPDVRLGSRRQATDPFRAVMMNNQNRVGTSGRFEAMFTAPRLMIDGVPFPLGAGDVIVDVVESTGGDTIGFAGRLSPAARAKIATGFERAQFEVDVTIDEGRGSPPVTHAVTKPLTREYLAPEEIGAR